MGRAISGVRGAIAATGISVLGVSIFATAAAAAQPSEPTIRIGNLANAGEFRRFEQRVRQGCGHDASITTQGRPSTEARGRIVGQHPQRGTRLRCADARAIIYVSAGPQIEALYVPALLEPGRRIAFSKAASAVCGKRVIVDEQWRSSPEARGRFLEQVPAQGLSYRCGAPVTVYLSPGPGRRSTPPSRLELASAAAAKAVSLPPAASPPVPAAPPIPKPAPEQLRTDPPEPLPAVAAPYKPAARPALPKPVPVASTPQQSAVRTPQWAAPWPLALVPLALLLGLAAVHLIGRPRVSRHKPENTMAAPPSRQPTVAAAGLKLRRETPSATASLIQPNQPQPRSVQPRSVQLPAVQTGLARPSIARIEPPFPHRPLLRDIWSPAPDDIDHIAGTSLALASAAGLGRPAGHETDGETPDACGETPNAGGETLGALRQDISDALDFALLFELAPLLAQALAAADPFPSLPADSGRGLRQIGLSPQRVQILLDPQLVVTAAGLDLFALDLRLRFDVDLASAHAVIQGNTLEALLPGPVQLAATLTWAGKTRKLPVRRESAHWPGPIALVPPRHLHGLPPAAAVVAKKRG